MKLYKVHEGTQEYIYEGKRIDRINRTVDAEVASLAEGWKDILNTQSVYDAIANSGSLIAENIFVYIIHNVRGFMIIFSLPISIAALLVNKITKPAEAKKAVSVWESKRKIIAKKLDKQTDKVVKKNGEKYLKSIDKAIVMLKIHHNKLKGV